MKITLELSLPTKLATLREFLDRAMDLTGSDMAAQVSYHGTSLRVVSVKHLAAEQEATDKARATLKLNPFADDDDVPEGFE